MNGVVTQFDDPRGLGEVTGEDGAVYPFHCTQIADGSRTIAEGTEVRALSTLRRLLNPEGRILVGFHLRGGPVDKREEYVWEEFSADVAAAGLTPQHHFGGYALEPPGDEYCVAVLALP